MNTEKRAETKLAIVMVVGGFLFTGGEVEDVPNLLREIADDYVKKIKEEQE